LYIKLSSNSKDLRDLYKMNHSNEQELKKEN
jgi:hypothetical protein